MKCIDLTGIILAWFLAAPVATASELPARQAEARPAIGMWLTVWWTEDDQCRHWVNCHRFPSPPPAAACVSTAPRVHPPFSGKLPKAKYRGWHGSVLRPVAKHGQPLVWVQTSATQCP